MRRSKVTLFMPTLNEVVGLRAMLPRIDPSWCDEIIVVDGGSTDGTLEELKKWGCTAIPQVGRGLTPAWNTGFARSTGDIFILFTPDGNCIPELIPTLIAKVEEGHDMVCASRYLPPAISHDDGFITALGNRIFTTAIRILFGSKFTDTLGGFRAYRRDAILAMNLHRQHEESWLRRRYQLINTWEIGSAIRAAKLGLRTMDVAGDEPSRMGGKSKLSVVRNGTAGVVQILHELVSGQRPLRAAARELAAAKGVAAARVAADQVAADRVRA
jgi:glycosyltransferase involved in cell wall biosynthesis